MMFGMVIERSKWRNWGLWPQSLILWVGKTLCLHVNLLRFWVFGNASNFPSHYLYKISKSLHSGNFLNLKFHMFLIYFLQQYVNNKKWDIFYEKLLLLIKMPIAFFLSLVGTPLQEMNYCGESSQVGLVGK